MPRWLVVHRFVLTIVLWGILMIPTAAFAYTGPFQ